MDDKESKALRSKFLNDNIAGLEKQVETLRLTLEVAENTLTFLVKQLEKIT